MALYAIGDVHGCARTLDALLSRIADDAGAPLGPSDTLVFVGDYVDRGPDSPGVLDRVLALEADAGGPRVVVLRGNHDQMMLDYALGVGDTELWWANGGRATLDAYAARGDVRLPDAHVDLLRRSGLVFEAEGYVFVHAGLDPRRTVAENLVRPDPDVVLWTRAHLNADLSRWERPVVCGHTPHPEPLSLPNLVRIDTGAVFADRPGLGHLTAVRIPERQFVSVPYCG
ncbi:MAG TPA: metallophosphoesterase family protein [Rubricoccaceae bacterium]